MAIIIIAITPQLYRGYIYVPLGDNLCYYLGSRFYNPQLGRFLNADKHTDTGTGVNGTNMFAYCNNNPARYIDPCGTSIYPIIVRFLPILKGFVDYAKKQSDFKVGYGITVDLGQGWKARIDKSDNVPSGHEKHVHVWKNGDEYSQNQDGSPHDGKTGIPPNKVRKKLKEKTGWEWKLSVTPEIDYQPPLLPEIDINILNLMGLAIGIVIFLLTGDPVGLQPGFA